MSLLSGIASLGGSLWSTGQNQASAKASMAAQKEYQQNKHQWEVADLKAAGLNPILSANSAGGSVSGATSTADNPGEALATGMSSAQQVKASRSNVALAQRQQDNADRINSAQVANIEADTAKKQQEVVESAERIPTYGSRVLLDTSSAAHSRANIGKINAEVVKLGKDIDNAEHQARILQQQRLNLEQELVNARSRDAYTRAEIGLANNRSSMIDLQKRTESLQQSGLSLSNQERDLGMSKREFGNSIYSRLNFLSDSLIDIGKSVDTGINNLRKFNPNNYEPKYLKLRK